jgi:hypothetical protein
MKEYRVVWEIDIIAYCPLDAAKTAQDIMQDKKSLAQVFKVGLCGCMEPAIEIDLLQE